MVGGGQSVGGCSSVRTLSTVARPSANTGPPRSVRPYPLGVALNALSILLVSLKSMASTASSTEPGSESSEHQNPLLGVALILAGSFVRSLQYVFEEVVMTDDVGIPVKPPGSAPRRPTPPPPRTRTTVLPQTPRLYVHLHTCVHTYPHSRTRSCTHAHTPPPRVTSRSS